MAGDRGTCRCHTQLVRGESRAQSSEASPRLQRGPEHLPNPPQLRSQILLSPGPRTQRTQPGLLPLPWQRLWGERGT